MIDNFTDNATSTSAVTLTDPIHDAYINYAYMLVSVSVFALLVYTTVLNMSREVMYIWLSSKKFSIPTLLYAFARYGMLISQGAAVWLGFVMPGERLCNNLANIQNATFLFVCIGIQGILVIRAYTLCQGNKVITGALALFFMGGLITNIYGQILNRGCVTSYNPRGLMVTSVSNFMVLSTESLVFWVCLWKVWGTWKLKGETGIRRKNDLVSMILRQVLSQFCFAILFTNALTIVDLIRINSVAIGIPGNFQHGFSTILITNFTLDLRQRNSAVIEASNATLPTIQFRSVLQYVHRSITVEMGDHENVSGIMDDNLGLPVGFSDAEVGRGELA